MLIFCCFDVGEWVSDGCTEARLSRGPSLCLLSLYLPHVTSPPFPLSSILNVVCAAVVCWLTAGDWLTHHSVTLRRRGGAGWRRSCHKERTILASEVSGSRGASRLLHRLASLLKLVLVLVLVLVLGVDSSNWSPSTLLSEVITGATIRCWCGYGCCFGSCWSKCITVVSEHPECWAGEKWSWMMAWLKCGVIRPPVRAFALAHESAPE